MKANQEHPVAITAVPFPRGQAARWSKDALCLFALSILLIVSWIPRYRGPIDLRWDAGVYYVLGTSLAEGKGYRLLNEPGKIRAIQYPPGLPAIIAAEETVLRTNQPAVVGIWLRRSWVGLSFLYVVLAFLFARQFLSRRYSLLLAAACLLNYEMYFVSTLAFAELPFAVSSTAFGYFYFKRKQGIFTRLAAPVAAVTSYLLRSIGIALLLAWISDAVLRKRYRQAVMRAAIALVPVILWQSYIYSVESSDCYKHPYYAYQRDPSMFYNVSYGTNVSLKSPFQPEQGFATGQDLLVRFIGNFVRMPRTLGEAVSAKKGFGKGHVARVNRWIHPLALPWWSFQIVLVYLGLIVCAGMVWQGRRRNWFISVYLLLTIAAICTTTWTGQFARYLAPVEPYLLIVLLSFLLDIKRVSVRWPVRVRRITPIVTAATAVFVLFESVLSCIVGYRNFRDKAVFVDANGVKREYTLFHYPREAAASQAGMEWLMTHVDPNAIVAVSMPQWVFLKTGLKTVMPPLEPDWAKVQKLIDSVPASYAVVDQLLMEDEFNRSFPRLVRGSPDRWRLVYRSPHHEFDIYQRVGLSPIAQPGLLGSTHDRSLRF